MPKIMLVEDDNNLREIYGERLLAEGYEIVSASDGEEALALAVKEKPDLIISDVMMPKISGFDMLDILRQTPETKNTQVIMMTALSQAEDKERADKLGADKYLVKSQVTLEDVARVVHDMIYGPEPEAPVAEPMPAAPLSSPVEPVAAPAPQPVAVAPEPVVAAPAPVVSAPEPVVAAPEPVVAAPPVEPAAPAAFVPPTPDPLPAPEPVVTTAPLPDPAVAVAPEPVVAPVAEPVAAEPTAEPLAQPDQAAAATEASTDAQDVASEKAEVDQQIQSFIDGTQAPTPAEPVVAASAEPAAPVATETTVVEPTEIPVAPTEAPAEEPQPANIPRPMDENVPDAPSARKKVIEPISDPTATPNINELYEKEMAAEAANTPVANPATGAVIGTPEQSEPAASDPQNPASFAL